MLTTAHEPESGLRLDITIYVSAWLLWASLGIVLAAVSLVGLGFYAPKWAVWAAGFGLTLVGMLLTGLGICILGVMRCWFDTERDRGSRKSIVESGTDSYRMFPGL